VVVGAWSHPLSLSGGSASFFEVLMVGGVLGGGCERGDAGDGGDRFAFGLRLLVWSVRW
jgi:hypothetical protein